MCSFYQATTTGNQDLTSLQTYKTNLTTSHSQTRSTKSKCIKAMSYEIVKHLNYTVDKSLVKCFVQDKNTQYRSSAHKALNFTANIKSKLTFHDAFKNKTGQ